MEIEDTWLRHRINRTSTWGPEGIGFVFESFVELLLHSSPSQNTAHTNLMSSENAQNPPIAPSPLTIPEKLLLRIASRVDAAFRYKEAHPDGDFSKWMVHLSKEVVSPPTSSHCPWRTTCPAGKHQGRL